MKCHIEAEDGSVTGVCECGGIAEFEGAICGGGELLLSCGSCGLRFKGHIPPIMLEEIDEEAELVSDLIDV